MANSDTQQHTLPVHGAAQLPQVTVDSYNLEIEDKEGFVGDRASKGGFARLLDDVRETLSKTGEDPFGDTPSEEIGKKKLDAALHDGDLGMAAIVHSAVEAFAQELATVIRRYTRLKSWRDTERIVVGGGFSAGRVGALAVSRAEILLRSDDIDTALDTIHNDPDEAGLIGAVHLLPPWMLKGHEAMLAVDIGGTNIRCGVVSFNQAKAGDLSKASVSDMKLWRHAKEEKLKRDEAVSELAKMLKALMKGRSSLAPVIGIGCPGVIEPDGAIDRGAQNLPGNWESGSFNLPACIREAIPEIDEHETLVVVHNDAVVQGLSELPRMQDVERWGVLTIGTGLGNARFSNRRRERD